MALAEVLGESPGLKAVVQQIEQLLERRPNARRLPPILIQGETGTGKGLVAQSIHHAGPRAAGPFVHLNCAAIPETMLEAELFGFERGAFTDAKQPKAGLFQAAHRGTLFLDEVGLLSEGLQGKLLTAVEEQAVRRLGSTRSEPVDVWILAANSEDLKAAVKSRRFREDLYHRLAVLTLWLPPLRERGHDALLLADHFLARACADYGLPPKRLAPGARAALAAHHWPGNVRELSNVIERVALLFDEPQVTAEMLALPPSVQPEQRARSTPQPIAFSDGGAGSERDRLVEALRQTEGNVSRAAAWLNISRNTLRYRMEKHGLGLTLAQAPHPRPGRIAVAEASMAARTQTTTPMVRWERRHLAMLRAALSERSEGLAREPTRALETAIEKVRLFGGRVEELSPGAMVAVFGIDAGENAAQRAALAARAILKASHRARQGEGVQPAGRLAIHVSQMLMTQLDGVAEIELEDKRAACAVLAALTEEAHVDSIRVSAAALPFLERRFELIPVTRQVYELSGPERAGSSVQRARLVGRHHEIELLRRRFDMAARGQGQVIGIVGDAGIGKSRLLLELRQALAQERVSYLEGRCVSHGNITPYLPVLDLVRGLCGTTDADSPQATAKSARAALQELGMEPTDALPYIQHLLGLEDGAQRLEGVEPELIKARTRDIVRQMMVKTSERRPLIVVVEDLHWSDQASEEYFAALTDAVAGARILLLFSYRPGYQPPWIGRSYATQIALQPLPAEESASIVRAVLGTSADAEPMVQHIVAKAGGNPFFIEELACAVRAQGDATSNLVVPDTIQDAILARVNVLPSGLKRLLQCAAALGAQFPAALLGALSELDERELRQGVAGLQATELLHERSAISEREYAFKHVLTQQTVYENLVEVERRELHKRIVLCIERLHDGRLGEHVEHLAYHALQAEAWEKAVRYLQQAGAKAAARSAHHEAAAFYEQALAALPQLPDTRARAEQAIDLRFDVRTSLHLLGEFERVLEHLRQAHALAEALGDEKRLGWVSSYLMQYYRNTGDQVRAKETGQRAIAIGEKLGDFPLLVTTDTHLGVVHGTLGDYRQAVELLRGNVKRLSGVRARERFGMAGLPYVLSSGYLASFLAELGEFGEALERANEGLAIAESVNDAYSVAFACVLVGHVACLRGRPMQALPVLERAIKVCRTRSFRILLPSAACWGGAAFALARRFDEAIPLLEEAVAAAMSVKRKDRYAIYLARLAEGYLQAGRIDEVREPADRSLRLACEQGERGHEAYALRLLAESASRAAIPDVATAAPLFAKAMALAEALGMRPLLAHCHAGLGRLHGRMENRARERAELEVAAALYREMDLRHWLTETHST